MIRRYFYDFEFLEDGRTIDPISVGVVCDDGREFYAVFEEIAPSNGLLHRRICEHQWLMANVVPHLPLNRSAYGGNGFELGPPRAMSTGAFSIDPDSTLVKPKNTIRKELRAFLLNGVCTEGCPTGSIELWAYYAAYDHVALAQLLGGPMSNLPKGIPWWTHDLQQELDRRGLTPDDLFSRDPNQEHNALEDARWNMAVWRSLQKMEPTQ